MSNKKEIPKAIDIEWQKLVLKNIEEMENKLEFIHEDVCLQKSTSDEIAKFLVWIALLLGVLVVFEIVEIFI